MEEDMNTISRMLKQTKSIRDYTDTEITPEIREDILACACAAPSAVVAHYVTSQYIVERYLPRTCYAEEY